MTLWIWNIVNNSLYFSVKAIMPSFYNFFIFCTTNQTIFWVAYFALEGTLVCIILFLLCRKIFSQSFQHPTITAIPNIDWYLFFSLQGVILSQIVYFCHWLLYTNYFFTNSSGITTNLFAQDTFYCFTTSVLQLKLFIIFWFFLFCFFCFFTYYLWIKQTPSHLVALPLTQTASRYTELVSAFLTAVLFCIFSIKASNFFFLWCFLEGLTISVLLCLLVQTPKNVFTSTITYFIFNACGGVFLLWGISFFYSTEAGIVLANFSPVFVFNDTAHLVTYLDPVICNIGFLLLSVGFFIKFGIIPFHFWMFDVYKNLNIFMFFFLTLIVKTAIFFSFIRIIAVLQGSFFWIELNKSGVILLLGVLLLSALVSLTGAFFESNFRRFLLYSSNFTFSMLLLIVLLPETSSTLLSFGLGYFSMYTFSMIIICLILLHLELFPTFLVDLRGLHSHAPVWTYCLAMLFFSLGGVPPFIGFFIKFYLFLLLVVKGYLWFVIIFLFCSLISIIYYLRVIALLFKPTLFVATKTFGTNGDKTTGLDTKLISEPEGSSGFFIGLIVVLIAFFVMSPVYYLTLFNFILM